MRAGQRVMASISSFLDRRMGLKVNEEKSGVRQPHDELPTPAGLHFVAVDHDARRARS